MDERAYFRGFGFGMGMHHGRHFRAGFGLKYFILALANKKPIRGADVMNYIEEITHGYWRPSPGHVYFELERLVDEGYLSVNESEEGKFYKITQEGKKLLEEISDWFPISKMLDFEESTNKSAEIREKINELIDSMEKRTNDQSTKQDLRALRGLLDELW